MEALGDRIASKIEPEPMSGCWLWTAYIDRDGYGLVGYNGQTRRAHRVVYEILVGPIPKGLDLDHLCRNRACVSPWHLEPVTRKENLARGELFDAAGHQRNKTECPQGHLYDDDNTYVNPAGSRECRTCNRAKSSRHYLAKKSGPVAP